MQQRQNGQKRTERTGGASSVGMVLRLRKTEGKSPRIRLLEQRRDHFRKTLLFAGALGVLAVCVYFFSHSGSVQAHEETGGSAAASVQSAHN